MAPTEQTSTNTMTFTAPECLLTPERRAWPGKKRRGLGPYSSEHIHSLWSNNSTTQLQKTCGIESGYPNNLWSPGLASSRSKIFLTPLQYHLHPVGSQISSKTLDFPHAVRQEARAATGSSYLYPGMPQGWAGEREVAMLQRPGEKCQRKQAPEEGVTWRRRRCESR